MKAIVLAGGGLPFDLRGVAPEVSSKAFLPLQGKPIVEYVSQTLYHCALSEIVLVGDEKAVTPAMHSQIDRVVPSGSTIIDSLTNGMEPMKGEKQVLVCAGDLPLLNVEVVQNFIRSSQESLGELTYAIVRREDSEAVFPGFTHTYVKLKDGSFCGGGLFMLPPRALENFRRFMEQITEMRKTPWKLAGLMGFDIIVKWIFKTLNISDLEIKAGQLLGVSAKAIISSPETAYNIDNLIQYKSAVNFFAGKEKFG